MALTIQVVDLHSKQEIEHFLHLPWTIYATPGGHRDPHWVPPFLPDQRSLLHPHKNPYHQHSRTKPAFPPAWTTTLMRFGMTQLAFSGGSNACLIPRWPRPCFRPRSSSCRPRA